MVGKELGFDVVYRGQTRERIAPGSYWLEQVYDDCFVFAIERPVALMEGIEFLMVAKENELQMDAIQNLDDFKLT
ncbi:MAG: hypothetical protein P4L95_06640 [Rouxiella aceris]|uniref:hypothetical protein n=1 Tax=Rouxiella aceris TaxID=2703884 RepID=UPI0028477798|nr:hypothetical protein [Rouxiella aceris]MDR3431572.1 hypothetical protein [Rouxiella aceris]